MNKINTNSVRVMPNEILNIKTKSLTDFNIRMKN